MDFTRVIDSAKKFAGKKKLVNSYDDLLVDRLHNRYTVALLVCFCIAISTYQYTGTPLECWVPAQFTRNYEDYTNRLCYIQNTYHVAKTQILQKDSGFRRERTLKYYQWINFVLLLQAFFFSFPRIIWQSFNDKMGLSVRSLVDASNQYHSFDTNEDRVKSIKYICDCLQRYEEYVNPPKRINLSHFERIYRQWLLFHQGRTGISLSCFYIFIKLLYILNLICQILFLQYFLSYHDIDYFHYGWNVLDKLLSNFSIPESKLFPRITLCDFQIRELGKRHYYTVECILVINIFIEKMYFVLWIWFGILLIITIIDTINFAYQIFFRHCRNAFLVDNLELIFVSHIPTESRFQRFRQYFPVDNLLILRIISANSYSLIVAEILYELFQRKIRDASYV